MKLSLILVILLQLTQTPKEFPFEKLRVKDIFYEFTQDIENVQDAEIELIIEFEPFNIEGEEFTLITEFVGFSNPDLERNIFSNGSTFKGKNEVDPSSIYLQSRHNPIRLNFLKIEKRDDLEIFEIELLFDFEYEQIDYKNHLYKIKYEKEK